MVRKFHNTLISMATMMQNYITKKLIPLIYTEEHAKSNGENFFDISIYNRIPHHTFEQKLKVMITMMSFITLCL